MSISELVGSTGVSPHIILLGNEKGGSGKSTTAMHIIAHLLADGFQVGSIDLDSRQRTLTRYLENREAFAAEKDILLQMPQHRLILKSGLSAVDESQGEERSRFAAALANLVHDNDVIVIDCPGSDSYLSRLAHAYADTLITPMNDSFVDIDLLARIDPESYEIKSPSLYSEMVWESRKRRAMQDKGTVDWIVMRNRLSSLNAKNKEKVYEVLAKLARRVGFRFVAGLSERVIYRELFLKGLTLLDIRDADDEMRGGALTMSHIAARQELRSLMDLLHLPKTRYGVLQQAG